MGEVEDEGNQGGNELSFTASHNAVEFSADMDIIPFALPYRRKSACLSLAPISPTPLVTQKPSTHLLNTIHKPIRNPPLPDPPSIPNLDPPRQLRRVEIRQQSRGEEAQLDSLVCE